MSKFEKRLVVFAIVFVVVYLGAIALTLQSRARNATETTRLESEMPGPAEGRLLLAQLLPPMLVLLTISICFIVAKKRRARDAHTLENSEPPTAPPAAEN